MNEKQIMNEINQSINGGTDHKTVMELQNRIERITDINMRRVGDMNKLRQCVERLKCDVQVLFLSKKLNKTQINNNTADLDESLSGAKGLAGEGLNQSADASTDSDKQIGDQIQNTIDYIVRLEQTLREDMQQITTGGQSGSTTAMTTNLMGDDVFSPEKQIGQERRISQYNNQDRSKTLYCFM